jgi:hypothetical protein
MQTPNPRAPDFASIGVNNNAVAVTIPLVNSFTLIGLFDNNGPDRNSQSDQANEQIIIGSSGVFEITVSAHAESAGANKSYAVFIFEIDETGKTITGSTKADPVVVTATAHGFSNGDEVLIQGVTTMVEINDRIFKVADKAANTFELTDDGGASPANDIDGSAFAGAGTGGTAYLATRTRVHIHQKFVTATAINPAADSYHVALTAGKKLMVLIAGLTDTSDYTPEHMSLTMKRID